MNSSDILNFWFEEIAPKQHWIKNPEFDQLITDRFLDLHTQASISELYLWRKTPEGRLAEIIILDQFSRNIYRDTPHAFAQDPLALALAQEAVQSGDDKKLNPKWVSFLYMPYMHSESKIIHKEALRLFSQPGMDPDFEIRHKKIIDRFNRYPHRNDILLRPSTKEEIEFLKEKDSSF